MWNWLVMHIGKGDPIRLWLILFVASGIAFGIATGFFKARKIQPKGFKWKIFRHEAIWAVVSVAISGVVIGYAQKWLVAQGVISYRHEAVRWWVTALEYAGYFIGFDTWFYWLHRAMHKEPAYRMIHKLHHKSTSPNLLTTLSVNPLESFINGGFVLVYTALISVHDQALALILPTNLIMGPYVHLGYELFPRWWNNNWLTKWFITATFHDHHHRYFNYNFGGYTTVWDRICGTVRPKFEEDFIRIKDRARAVGLPESAGTVPAE